MPAFADYIHDKFRRHSWNTNNLFM